MPKFGLPKVLADPDKTNRLSRPCPLFQQVLPAQGSSSVLPACLAPILFFKSGSVCSTNPEARLPPFPPLSSDPRRLPLPSSSQTNDSGLLIHVFSAALPLFLCARSQKGNSRDCNKYSHRPPTCAMTRGYLHRNPESFRAFSERKRQMNAYRESRRGSPEQNWKSRHKSGMMACGTSERSRSGTKGHLPAQCDGRLRFVTSR